MDILYILRPEVEQLPPVISQIHVLAEKGHNITIVSMRISDYAKRIFYNPNITFLSLTKYKEDKNSFNKIINIWRFRKLLSSTLSKKKYDIIWIGSVDTAVYCKKILKGYKNTIFNIFELYDKFPNILSRIKEVAQKAKVVIVPEYNRAHILKVWLNLQKRPLVIPNKPYFPEVIAEKSTLEIVKKLKSLNKKIILYQGWISEERDISRIIEALSMMETQDEFKLVLMGPVVERKSLNIIKEKYPNVIYIPYLKPPQHLYVTELAYIGIATYDDSSLNTIFCAPNKIYEYALKGVPILARDIPGLKNTVGNHNIGICVDTYNKQDIINAILNIDKNHEQYVNATQLFLKESDISQYICSVLDAFSIS